MIMCDKCNAKNESDKDIDFFKIYFFPQYMQVKKPYKIDVCENCLFELMGEKVFRKMLTQFNNEDIEGR